MESNMEAQLPPSTSPSDPAPPAAATTDTSFAPRLPPLKNKDLFQLRTLAEALQEGRTKGAELSPESRIAVVAAAASGLSRGQVADAFGISLRTVRNALERWESRKTNASKPRTGRPPKLTAEDERAIVHAAQMQPNISPKVLGQAHGVSAPTAKRVLRKYKAGKYAETGRNGSG